MTSKLSVIIPVYNASKYLLHCWSGLKNQIYKDIEYIFVDDCSTDDSWDILKEISNTDTRIKLLKTLHNSGVSAARNLGLDVATGKYIGFCDADDFALPTMYLDMVNLLEDLSLDISCCALKRVDNTGRNLNILFSSNKAFEFTPQTALKYWLTGTYIGNSVYTKVFRAALWEGIRFPEGEIFEEAYVIPQLILKANKIGHVGKVEYMYYMRPNSYTSKLFSTDLLVVYKREYYIERLLSEKKLNYNMALGYFKARQNMGLYYTAIETRMHGRISDETYMTVKKEFMHSAFIGIFCQYSSIREKLKMIELCTGMAILRKRWRRCLR